MFSRILVPFAFCKAKFNGKSAISSEKITLCVWSSICNALRALTSKTQTAYFFGKSGGKVKTALHGI